MVDQHLEGISRKGKERERNHQEPASLSKKHLGEGDVRLDKEKLEQAIREEREKKRKGWASDDRDGESTAKRKKYNSSNGNHEVTEEELGMSFNLLSSPCITEFLLQRHIG